MIGAVRLWGTPMLGGSILYAQFIIPWLRPSFKEWPPDAPGRPV